MKICMPTMDDTGLHSNLHDHFGSATYFTIVDTETDQVQVTANGVRHHAHGHCRPLQVFAGETFDAVLTGGMGRRALETMNKAGIKVYKLAGATVADAVAAMKAGRLTEMTPESGCGGHGHGHSQGHGCR